MTEKINNVYIITNNNLEFIYYAFIIFAILKVKIKK